MSFLSFSNRWAIRTKFLVIITLLIGGIALFISLYFPSRLERLAIERVKAQSTSLGEVTAYSASAAVFFEDKVSLKEVLEALRQDREVLYAVLLDESGDLIASFNQGKAQQSSFLRSGNSDQISEDGTVYQRMTPILKDGQKIGELYLGSSLDRVRAEVAASQWNVAFVSLVIFVLGMVGGLIASFMMTAPLKQMVQTVDNLAKGGFKHRAVVSSKDEIGQLAGAFNEMVDSLESAHVELKEMNRTLERRVEDRTKALQEEMDQRKEIEEQLLQAQKMEAIGRLSGGVAHDFNNILTAIIGYSDLLLIRASKGKTNWEYVRQIKKAAERAASLTQQLLAFSRKQVLQPRLLDLHSLVCETEKMLRRLIGEDIDLEVISKPNQGHVKADPGQIQQVILNLAVNARDAMPKGGRLSIETAVTQVDQRRAAQSPGLNSGDYVTLTVSDNGSGMDGETLLHIFEPFYTTKGPGEGTGLGLATVYGVVKQSGGYITVYSEPGNGSKFRIYLPLVDLPAQLMDSQEVDNPLPVEGSDTILLVEDEEPVRTLTRKMLESAGYAVLEASNGREALETSERYREPIHLIITDMVMPLMSGTEVAETLLAARPETKVLFISGYSEQAIACQGALASRGEFLPKPFTLQDLSQKVHQVLDTGLDTSVSLHGPH